MEDAMGSKRVGTSASDGFPQSAYVAAGIKRAEGQAVAFPSSPPAMRPHDCLHVEDCLLCPVGLFSFTNPIRGYFLCFIVLYKTFWSMPTPRCDFPMFPSNCFKKFRSYTKVFDSF